MGRARVVAILFVIGCGEDAGTVTTPPPAPRVVVHAPAAPVLPPVAAAEEDVADDVDHCPEAIDGLDDYDSCPDARVVVVDRDDGGDILDSEDRCPDVPDPNSEDGCPEPAAADGVLERAGA